MGWLSAVGGQRRPWRSARGSRPNLREKRPGNTPLGAEAALSRWISLLFFWWHARICSADLNYPEFSIDPVGRNSHIRLVGGSSLNYYSGEFVETCPTVTAPAIPNPTGITQRFEHPERREMQEPLPSYTYLDDDQLDNPFAGRISYGNYTEVVITDAFVPDGDLLPLPHDRTQLCHFAIRLTPPESAQNTASWSRFKQLVAYGFETEFHFRVLHRSQECVSVGLPSEWCQSAGADGFAFVIQNDGRQAVGTEVGGLGYSIPKSVAVEFDTYKDPEHGELSNNHISVHVPPRVGQANTANHETASIAHTEDIPNLQEGTHVVRIAYTTKNYNWNARSEGFEDDLKYPFLSVHSSGRLGLLTVELDGRRVLAVPLDLATAVQVDPTATAKENPPEPPDISAYDELGATPGRAWVGFTSSTNYFQWQAVDILSWTFKEEQPCPRGGHGDIICGMSSGIQGRATCKSDGSELCALVIQNAARQPIKFSAHLSYDKPFEATPCSRGHLEWDQLHPYFLGCSRTLRFPFQLDELWINTVDGTRSVKVTEAGVLQKAPQPFIRQSLFRWCVVEHRTDPTRLQVAQCNCEYCVRLMTVQSYYAQFYQQRCGPRFGLTCQCLEASGAEHDMTRWTLQEPLQNIRLHVCRGCSYNSQCNRALKVAVCEQAYRSYTVGNPLAPTIFSNGFEGTSRDNGKVPDGVIRGDACNCEPDVSPYAGDNSGRRGQCTEQFQLNIGSFGTLAPCASFCRAAANCAYFTYWESDGECRIYEQCIWQICNTERCVEGNTYRLALLGEYTDLRGDIQEFNVFPLRTVQTSQAECLQCLHLYEEEYCAAQCGPASQVPYSHWPAGQMCSSCIFAGNRMHELTMAQKETVKACVYEATRNSEDPWIVCDGVAVEHGGVPAIDLFNGVVTHHLSECPGRSFNDVGAVCTPNLHVRNMFPHQILSRMAAIGDTVWGPSLECLNSLCQLVPKGACYVRLAVFNFTQDYGDAARDIPATPYNGANLLVPAGLQLRKGPEQYVLSELLNFSAENITMEAWVTVSTSEQITNLAAGRNATANTDWSLDYLSQFALDGNLETYWSSQLGTAGEPQLDATWGVDLLTMQYAGGVVIYWKEAARRFAVWASNDQITWRLLTEVTDNQNLTSHINTFFYGRYVRVVMKEALHVRPPGPGEGRPVYSIRELEILRDDNVARLRPTTMYNAWDRPGKLAVDDDNETWWATPPHTGEAEVLIDLSDVFEVLILRVHWRYPPRNFRILLGDQPCAVQDPTFLLASYSSELLPDYIENVVWRDVQCVRVSILETKKVYGEHMTAIREVQVYQDGDNAAPRATVAEVWPPDENGAHITPVQGALDGDPSTHWFLQPTDGTATLTLDLGSLRLIQTIDIRWARIDGQTYFATQFSVQAGTTLDDMTTRDMALNYILLSKRFLLNSHVRFVRLRVTTIMGSNPLGRLALEDLVLHQLSDNLASRCITFVSVSSAWCDSDLSSYACVTSTSSTTTASTSTITTVTHTTSSTSTTSTTSTSSTTNTTTDTTSTTITNTSTSTSGTETQTTSTTLVSHTSTTSSTSTETTSTTSTLSSTTTSTSTTTVTSVTSTTSTTTTTTTTTTVTTTTTTVTSTTSTSSSTTTETTLTTSTTTSATTVIFENTTTVTTETTTVTTVTTGTTTTSSTSTITGTSTTTTLPNFQICNKPIVSQPCVASTIVNGTDRPHSPAMAVDDDFDTWWGVTGVEVGDLNYIDFTYDPPTSVGLVGIRWRYPATEVTVFCAAVNGGQLQRTGRADSITTYKTAVAFDVGVRVCANIRVSLGGPLERLAGEGIIGIREVEVYDTTNNLALTRPITASDGTLAIFANDETAVTKWISLSNAITHLTIDLGASESIWGLRILYSTGLVSSLFCVMSSNDNINFKVEESVSDNSVTDVNLLARFTARYVRIYFVQTLEVAYSVRTIEVYGTPNIAENGNIQTNLFWDHSAAEAVDGDSSTFWVSEPLATSAVLQVDMLEEIFVAGGIRIFWKFPAEDFSVWIANDTTDSGAWQQIFETAGNLNNVTEIFGAWEARYLELRMTRPSRENGDGSYSIYDFDVMFDENLARYKTVWASHRINETAFLEDNAADSNLSTYWMSEQGSTNSTIVFDLLQPYFVSGFDVFWRRPPRRYRVETLDPDDLQWYFVGRWDTNRAYFNVGTTQSWFEGFSSLKFRITVEEPEDSAEGTLVALREVLFHIPQRSANIATDRPVSASHNEILGNRDFYANDGNERGTYWQPGWGVYSAWLMVELDPLPVVVGERPPGHDVGRMQIFWRHPPWTYSVEFLYDGNWETVWSEVNASDLLLTDFSKRRKVNSLRINVDTYDTEIGILEIKVFLSFPILPPRVEPRNSSWQAPASAMIDHSFQSYWMSPPLQNEMTVTVDLFKTYRARDVEIWFGFRPQRVKLFVSAVSENPTDQYEKGLTSTDVFGLLHLEDAGVAFDVRYLRIYMRIGYVDEESSWGTSIRDIAVLVFRNVARDRVAYADSIWGYEPSWSVDGDPGTEWVSRFGQQEAQLIVDLGQVKNVAGMQWNFGYGAKRFQISFSVDGNTWIMLQERRDNLNNSIVVDSTVHFHGRYVMLDLFEAIDVQFHPDKPGDGFSTGTIFSISEMQVFEHTGGGGMFGIQSDDGMAYTTIAYGLRQPGEWVIASEQDILTNEITGPNSGAYPVDVGNLAHIVATFQTLSRPTPGEREVEIRFYRNGFPYGDPYTRVEPFDRLREINTTRIVLGVRSSAHDVQPGVEDPREGVVHGFTHSPYFEGIVWNVTIIQNALTPEEVLGLYQVARSGGEEKGCHCYDACPTGSNRFFPGYPIPCSGQGVCRRYFRSASLAPGYCDCNPGYSGEACEHHCSELSSYGCCEVDDDCPAGASCVPETKACSL